MKKASNVFLLMLLILILVFTLTTETFATIDPDRPKKIDTTLWEFMNTVDDAASIPIHIALKDMDETALLEKVKSKTGMDPDIYMNEDRFEKEVASKIKKILEEKVGYEEAHKTTSIPTGENQPISEQICTALRSASNELNFLFDSESIIEAIQADRSVSIIDYAILQVRQTFQAEKNQVLREEQISANNAFISNHVRNRNNEITYASSYIATLFLKAKKADVLYYAQLPEVVSISYNNPDYQLKPTIHQASQHVGADSTTGTKSTAFNHGSGFQGTGITIGIIEAEGVIDASSPHFDASRMQIVSDIVGPLKPDTHASLVTAIAAGKSVTFQGATYTGIVPEANVYITQAYNVESLFNCLDLLTDYQVNIINMSLGILNTTTYTSIDRDLDRFINRTGITCVVAAGNNAGGYGDKSTYISSPGYALNCITVGNLETKSSGSSSKSAPYAINASSSWEEPFALPNKPDICAPGTWIRAVRSVTGSNPFYYDLENKEPSGTSFAAPIVTGVVAQMMQEHSAKIGNPQAVKAKIMNTANSAAVSTTNNSTQGNAFLREKSGAGLVNAKNAMSGYAYKYAKNHEAVESSFITQFTVNLAANQKIRATLAFSNKNTNVVIQNNSQYYNMDLRIIDANTGAILFAATQSRNNVEIAEYTTTTARTVLIQTRIVSNIPNVKTDWALEVDRY